MAVDWLEQLGPDEDRLVLRRLLARHPELAQEARQVADEVVSAVDVEAIAAEVEDAVSSVDPDEVCERSGRKSWGYVDPGEAAGELLEEAVAPFVESLRRRIELGLGPAAVATCKGIVLGLYRCRGSRQGSERALDWAEDFPEETAAAVVKTLRAARSALGVGDPFPATFIRQVPEWSGLLRLTDHGARRARKR